MSATSGGSEVGAKQGGLLLFKENWHSLFSTPITRAGSNGRCWKLLVNPKGAHGGVYSFTGSKAMIVKMCCMAVWRQRQTVALFSRPCPRFNVAGLKFLLSI